MDRRNFLKLSFSALAALHIPSPEGHHVFVIDHGALVVSNIVRTGSLIKAKVVNGAWDLVLDTQTRMLSCYSNPAYGHDSVAELKDSHPYSTFRELTVTKSVGDVSEDMKPRTVQTGVWEEEQELVWDGENPKLDEQGNPVYEVYLVPVMERVVSSMVEDEYYGTITFYNWQQVTKPTIVDPLHGAGVDYNRILERVIRA